MALLLRDQGPIKRNRFENYGIIVDQCDIKPRYHKSHNTYTLLFWHLILEKLRRKNTTRTVTNPFMSDFFYRIIWVNTKYYSVLVVSYTHAFSNQHMKLSFICTVQYSSTVVQYTRLWSVWLLTTIFIQISTLSLPTKLRYLKLNCWKFVYFIEVEKTEPTYRLNKVYLISYLQIHSINRRSMLQYACSRSGRSLIELNS